MLTRSVLVRTSVAGIAAASLLGIAAPAYAAPAPDPNAPTITVGAAGPNTVDVNTRPGAKKTVWLVFEGGSLTGTPWNNNRDPETLNGSAIDFDPVKGDSAALRTDVARRLAELFSPFDITFTTKRPSADALGKDSPTDDTYGDVVIFTSEKLGASGLTLYDADDADGIAHSSTFGDASDNYLWVSNEGMVPDDTKQLAEVAAHEIGHTLGLAHHGFKWGAGPDDKDVYFTPDQGLWTPIMGSADDVAMVRWSDGTYPNATNPQDDLAVMTNQAASDKSEVWFLRGAGTRYSGDTCDGSEENPPAGEKWVPVNDGCDVPEEDRQYIDHHTYYSGRLDFLPDAVGDTDATATTLTSGEPVKGIIERNGDKDVYAITATTSGVLDVNVAAASPETMLDVLLTVRDSNGTVIATANPDLTQSGGDRRQGIQGAGAVAHVTVPAAGTYYAQIEGAGFGDITSIERTNTTKAAAAYGSLGTYTVTATLVAPQLTAKVDGRTVTLAASLGGDSLPIQYRIDGAGVQNYTGPFSVPGSSAATVTWTAAKDDLVSTSTLDVAATGAAATHVEALGQAKTVLVNEAATGFGVRATTANGHAVYAENVTFTITGGQTATGQTTVVVPTNAAGIAALPAVSASAAGTITVTANTSAGSVTLPTITVAAPAPSVAGSVSVTASTVAGKVVLTVVGFNESDAPATVQLKTKYGSKTFTSVPKPVPGQGGNSVTATIKTYATSIPAGSVTATITTGAGTNTVTENYDAYTAQ